MKPDIKGLYFSPFLFLEENTKEHLQYKEKLVSQHLGTFGSTQDRLLLNSGEGLLVDDITYAPLGKRFARLESSRDGPGLLEEASYEGP